MINHGTTSGYYAHRRLQEGPCEECRAAISMYSRDYRKKNGAERDRESDKVRRLALARLRDKHRDEYEMLVAEVRMERSGS